MKRKVCGVIITGRFEEEYLDLIYKTNIPIILVDHISYVHPIESILTDNRAGVLESVSYLIQNGYQKIGFFGDYSYSNSYKERFAGYMEGMQKIQPDFGMLFEMIKRYFYPWKYRGCNSAAGYGSCHPYFGGDERTAGGIPVCE